MKERNLDFEGFSLLEFLYRDFFIEMKYTIQNYLKKKYRHVGFCDFSYRSCSQ